MAKIQFRITAECGNRRCAIGAACGGMFIVNRGTIKKKSTSGREYTISQVVCPECKQWGKITKIEEVGA